MFTPRVRSWEVDEDKRDQIYGNERRTYAMFLDNSRHTEENLTQSEENKVAIKEIKKLIILT